MFNGKVIISCASNILQCCFYGTKNIIEDKIKNYFKKLKIEKFLKKVNKGQLLSVGSENCIIVAKHSNQLKNIPKGSIILVLDTVLAEHKLVCLYRTGIYTVLYECIDELDIVAV